MNTKIKLTENAEMLVDANVQLPNAAKNVLGALIYTRGAYTEYRGKNNDWFYKDAKSLIEESQVSRPTFFRVINLLEANNFIERKSGSLKKGENKVTLYKVLKGINIIPNDTLNDTNEYQKTPNDTLNDTLEEPLMIHKNKELSIKDKEIINKIEKDIINIIKKINLIKEEIELRKEEIPNNTENTNTSMDSNTEISKLSQRLDAAAKQFKQMKQTIKELKESNNELQVKVSKLEAKLNQTSNKDKTEAIQDSSISSSSSSTKETSTKQEKSDSKPSNEDDGIVTHQDEEKPTESDSEASMAIVDDVDADLEYVMFTSAVEACKASNTPYNSFTLLTFKNMILQDLSEKNASYRVRKDVEGRIDNFIQDFNEKSDLKPSNEQSGIVAHPKDEKPTEGKETASTAISEDNAATSNDVDDLFDGIIISGKASKKDEVKPSNKGTDCTPVQSEDTKQDDSKKDSKEMKGLKMPKTVEGCFQRYIESVEDLTNPTKADLNWRKDCIIQSCEKEGYDESFIQELKSKIDKYNEEKALKVEDSSNDEEDEAFREDTVSIQDKSSTTNEKPSSGITIPQDEEKPTEAQQMPSNGKELRYLDRKTGKQYATEAEAQNDGANPMFLYDTKSGRCVLSYTSPVSHSNDQSGIVANQDDLKLVEAKKIASTSISDSYASAQKEIEDSMEGDFASEPSLAIAV